MTLAKVDGFAVLAKTVLELCGTCPAVLLLAGSAKRAALATTSKELVAMPSPASQAGRNPATASGTQAAL